MLQKRVLVLMQKRNMKKLNRLINFVLIVALFSFGCSKKIKKEIINSERAINSVKTETIELPREIKYVIQPCDSAIKLKPVYLIDSSRKQIIEVFTEKEKLIIRVKTDTLKNVITKTDTLIVNKIQTEIVESKKSLSIVWILLSICIGLAVALFIALRFL